MNMGNNTDSNSTMDMNMTMDMDMDTMHTTFYNDHHYKLYFHNWGFDTESKYAGGIVALICISFAIELVYYLSNITARRARVADVPALKGLWWLITGCLVYAMVMFSYLMMLAVMTYSTGVFFGVVSGLSLGRLVFHYILAPTTKEGKVNQEGQLLVCH
mmetsp:Transcript_25069/g.43974  ORF Transcript_25069/g.43974 Transcript_25069/m.43974 type:complete len:159 (-) Transcript_25069:45-521(-)